MRIWVQILSTHIKSQVWEHTSVIPALKSRTGWSWWAKWWASGSVRSAASKQTNKHTHTYKQQIKMENDIRNPVLTSGVYRCICFHHTHTNTHKMVCGVYMCVGTHAYNLIIKGLEVRVQIWGQLRLYSKSYLKKFFSCILYHITKKTTGTEELVQHLRAHAALAEDSGPVPSTCMLGYNAL